MDFLALDNEKLKDREMVFFTSTGEIKEYSFWSEAFQDWIFVPLETIKVNKLLWEKAQQRVYEYIDKKNRRVS